MSQWGTLPGLAAYCAEAVRHAVPDRELQNVSGVVQHELQPAEVRDTAAATEPVTDQDDIAALKAHGKDADIENARRMSNEDRVHDEAARVRAKFTDQVDTATDVVVRFDFMTSYESRVINASHDGSACTMHQGASCNTCVTCRWPFLSFQLQPLLAGLSCLCSSLIL